MSQFYIGGSTSQSPGSTPAYSYSDSDDDDEDTLPYPTELPRSDFLATDFDPQIYLSSLRNRHQTLEDLRSDLRQRSQLLNKELLDLVNGNYEEFLSLGADLKGGEERIEGVRVGLLGFQREVEGIRKGVQDRLTETGELLREKKQLRRDIVLGRSLLEVHELIEELEESLGVRGNDSVLSDSISTEIISDGEYESDPAMAPIKRLQRHAQRFILIARMVSRDGSSHPFLQAQRSRVEELRRTLLLDLAAALRQTKALKAPDCILAIANMYGDLGAEHEAVRGLKGG